MSPDHSRSTLSKGASPTTAEFDGHQYPLVIEVILVDVLFTLGGPGYAL